MSFDTWEFFKAFIAGRSPEEIVWLQNWLRALADLLPELAEEVQNNLPEPKIKSIARKHFDAIHSSTDIEVNVVTQFTPRPPSKEK